MPWHWSLEEFAERRRRSLRVEHVSKTFPSGICALDDVSLSFEGGLCALLGADGSGKSTLLNIIAGVQPPDQGRVHFRNVDVVASPHRLRRVIGCVTGDPRLAPVVPVRVALEHFARRYLGDGYGTGVPAPGPAFLQELLDRVGLAACHAQHVGELSSGMMRRLGIAIALIKRPVLLLLDDPLIGLAPAERTELRALLSAVARDMLVLFTTSEPDDLNLQCAEAAVLHQGRVLFVGATDRVLDDLRGRVWRGTVPRGEFQRMRARHVITDTLAAGDQVTVRVVSDQPPGSRFTMAEPRLADAYLHLIDSECTPDR